MWRLYAFIKKDTDLALKFYELASLDWYDFANQKDWNISEADKGILLIEYKDLPELINC